MTSVKCQEDMRDQRRDKAAEVYTPATSGQALCPCGPLPPDDWLTVLALCVVIAADSVTLSWTVYFPVITTHWRTPMSEAG